jgi:hypothetical protein
MTGRVVGEGGSAQLMSDPAVQRAYLGAAEVTGAATPSGAGDRRRQVEAACSECSAEYAYPIQNSRIADDSTRGRQPSGDARLKTRSRLILS